MGDTFGLCDGGVRVKISFDHNLDSEEDVGGGFELGNPSGYVKVESELKTLSIRILIRKVWEKDLN